MDVNKPHSKTKVKSMSKSKTKSNVKSKSNLKSVSKSKTKTKSKVNSKSNAKSKVKVPIVINREHGELDQVYHMRRAFIESVLKKNRDLPMPYVNTLSYVHVYKKLYHYVYPAEIEKKLSDLLA